MKESIVSFTRVPDSLRWEHAWNIFNHQAFDYKGEAELIHKWICDSDYKVEKILDLACGVAYHSVYLERRGYSCMGVDRNVGSLEYAKRFVIEKDTPLFVGDILAEPSPEIEARFDLVLAKHLSFDTKDTETLLLNARRMLKTNGPKLIVLDFITTDGENLERDVSSMDTYTEDGFSIARVNMMELVAGIDRYDWQQLYLLKQTGKPLDIKVDSGSLWFHTSDDVMHLIDDANVTIDRSRSKPRRTSRLPGITIYGKFRD